MAQLMTGEAGRAWEGWCHVSRRRSLAVTAGGGSGRRLSLQIDSGNGVGNFKEPRVSDKLYM